MDTLNETAKKYEMKVNVRTTKAMVVSREVGIMVISTTDGQEVEQVKTFKCLVVIMA
jgi:hypothetical protein